MCRALSLARRSIERVPDREIGKLAAEFLPQQIHRAYARSLRSLATPGDELLDLRRRPFRDELDGTVAPVHHPAGKAEATRLVDGGSSIVNTLNSALDDYLYPSLRRHLHNFGPFKPSPP